MLADVIRKYQSYDPERGTFSKPRSMKEYAAVLGISYVYLSQIYSGVRNPGTTALARLVQVFPASKADVGDALASLPGSSQEVVPA